MTHKEDKFNLNYNIYDFENKYYFDGELGALYKKEKTVFRIWAPLAEEVFLLLYGKEGYNLENNFKEKIKMNYFKNGVYEIEVKGDLNYFYYNYLIFNYEERGVEVVDPYAKGLSINGKRGEVLDIKNITSSNFNLYERPKLFSINPIIYETHIRDFTIDSNSGVSLLNRGKYLGFTEEETVFKDTNIKTCLNHLVELGITHVHLQPVNDFYSLDEKNENYYNWGYNPLNYNSLEGSYSLNPYKGEIRIKEFKELVGALHKNGIGIILDVVYNHTFFSYNSNFNKILPNYYYRKDLNGNWSNGSGCGNELFSERGMVRKFIVDSIKFWAKEYKIDGFRFDLMGLTDIETIKAIRKELDNIDKNILLYGEGWIGGDSSLQYEKRMIKYNLNKVGDLKIAVFNDDLRDAIKGNVFSKESRGFISGEKGFEETIKFGVVGSSYHSEVNPNNILYSNFFWANEPYQTINYSSSHDNYTLWDKLSLSNKEEKEENKIKMNKLSATIIFTSEGIPFILGGEEFLRSKKDEKGNIIENSYNSNDFINKIYWERKIKYKDVFNCYKELINIRKKLKVFNLKYQKDINRYIHFFINGKDFFSDNFVSFIIDGKELNDFFEEVIVIYNSNKEKVSLNLPKGEWKVIFNSNFYNYSKLNKVYKEKFIADEISGYILAKNRGIL